MAKTTKQPNVSKLKSDLWTVFSRYIRLRDAVAWGANFPEYNGEPLAACITCRKTGKALGQGGMQAGHFIPGRKNAYLFDEVQVNAQCYSCNIGLKGNWPEYLKVMVGRHGQASVDKMINEQRNETRKFTTDELKEMIIDYKRRTAELESQV